MTDGAPGDVGVLQVRAIEVRYADAAAPAQRIDGLATDTPWSASAPGLALLDMNFDGYQDLRRGAIPEAVLAFGAQAQRHARRDGDRSPPQ